MVFSLKQQIISLFKKTSLEEEVLKYVGQPYIIYSPNGAFMRGHPKVSEVLWNLGLGEGDIQTRAALIAGLKSQEMKHYDDAARQILQEQIFLENTTNFAGIAEFEGNYILAQVKDAQTGSYALFKDVTNEYILLSSGTRLSFDTATMLGVLQNLPCGVIICDARDPNFPALCVNQPFLKTVSARGSDVQEKPLLEVLSRFFYHRDLYALMLDFTQNPKPFSLDIERHDNDFYQWVRLSAHCVMNELEVPTYFIITAEDLTDVKTRQAQKSQSYKMEMLGQLSSGVAHDFNNVLAVVEGYARLIKRDTENDNFEDVTRERIEHILGSVSKAAALVRQVMHYGSHTRLKPEVINLSDTIQDLEPLFKPLLHEAIHLHLDIDRDVYVRCAPDHMVQVLMNLVVNARDAMADKGGNLTVRLHYQKGSVQTLLQVRDEGCGMSEAVKNRIFDPYYTTKSNDMGTGLGMSTVQSLVHKMSADIDIETKEGEGTTMSLTIPVVKEPVLLPKASDAEEEGKPLQGLTILIVEDEEPVLDIFGQVLGSYGAHVLLAREGNQALALQEQYEDRIDVLLTDVVLPHFDGLHLAELFETARPETQAVFCSGYPEASHPALKKIVSDKAFVPKPVEHRKLLRVIMQAVGRLDKQGYAKPLHALSGGKKQGQEALYSMAGNTQDGTRDSTRAQ